jgi:transposase
MDYTNRTPYTQHKRKLSKKQIQEIKNNMNKRDSITALEAQYTKKEQEQLQSLNQLLKIS